MRPGERAWLALAAGVATYELAAKEDELLSSAADRWMAAHPWLTRIAVTVVAVHLVNGLPARADPLHWVFEARRLTH